MKIGVFAAPISLGSTPHLDAFPPLRSPFISLRSRQGRILGIANFRETFTMILRELRSRSRPQGRLPISTDSFRPHVRRVAQSIIPNDSFLESIRRFNGCAPLKQSPSDFFAKVEDH